MYLSITVKLLVGMLGIIFFLRVSGKTQMAQLTPLDSVNAFVLGALVGGVIYNPDTSVWQLVFTFVVWTAVNVALRYLMRFRRIRKAIRGDTAMLVRDRKLMLREFRRNGLEMEQFRTLLRENGIFSMFDVDDVRFETNGRITVSRRNLKPCFYNFFCAFDFMYLLFKTAFVDCPTVSHTCARSVCTRIHIIKQLYLNKTISM